MRRSVLKLPRCCRWVGGSWSLVRLGKLKNGRVLHRFETHGIRRLNETNMTDSKRLPSPGRSSSHSGLLEFCDDAKLGKSYCLSTDSHILLCVLAVRIQPEPKLKW